MADNVAITAGSGTTIAADEIVDGTLGTVKVQYVKLIDGTLDGTTKVAAGANGLKVDGSGVTQPVSGTVTANAGSGTMAVNNAQVSGTTVDTNSGVKSAGTQRVVLATDQPQLTNALKVDPSGVTSPVSGTVTANQGGTWTIQPGNTANTTPWLTTEVPTTTGGLSTFHLVSAATTNATNIKASAGQVYAWYIYNSNAAARKVAFHNTSGTPTAGASIFMSLVIPPSSGANVEMSNGIAFSTGIAITTVTGLADSDATAVALNDLIINIFYK